MSDELAWSFLKTCKVPFSIVIPLVSAGAMQKLTTVRFILLHKVTRAENIHEVWLGLAIPQVVWFWESLEMLGFKLDANSVRVEPPFNLDFYLSSLWSAVSSIHLKLTLISLLASTLSVSLPCVPGWDVTDWMWQNLNFQRAKDVKRLGKKSFKLVHRVALYVLFELLLSLCLFFNGQNSKVYMNNSNFSMFLCDF